MAKKRRNRKVIPFQHERTLTYNKAKPNRQARRLGIKPEEPKREEKKTVSKAAVLSQKAKQARETQRRITPPGKAVDICREVHPKKAIAHLIECLSL